MFQFVSNDRQTLFDLAVTHLFTMERPCKLAYSSRYLIRATGERCVIGALIETPTVGHEILLERLDGGVDCRIEQGVFTPPDDTLATQDMLASLQAVHDSSLAWDKIILGSERFRAISSLQTIAEEHRLDQSVLNGFIEQRRKVLPSNER
jgi:hypothetical protein